MLCRNHIDVSEGIRRCARCGSPFCQNCLVDIGGKPYCATCKSEEILDVRSGVQSGVLDLAGLGRRFVAALVDGFLMWIVVFVLGMVFGVLGAVSKNVGTSLGLNLTWQLLMWALTISYQAIMLSARGQTLGKMAMRVKVVNADGSDISTGQAWGRELARAVLSLLCIVDYIPIFFTDQKTTIHDMAAKTRVVNWA